MNEFYAIVKVMKDTVSAAFFTANRQKLAQKVKGGIVIVSGYGEMQRSNDIAFDFEQEASFWYLTGISAPDWWLIGDSGRDKWWLVAPKLSDVQEVFDGGVSADEAKKISGIDEVIDGTEALNVLRQLRRKHAMAYICDAPPYSDRFEFTLNPLPRTVKGIAERHFATLQDCRGHIARLRAIKQPEELELMKKAINLTVDAFKQVREKFQSYSWEYEIEADFTHFFRSRGAKGHAYDPIIAGGERACTMHYDQNQARLHKRSLVLMDIGASWGGYVADITRTYAYGELSKRQQEVHAAVVEAQQQIIALCRPGVSVQKYHEQSNEIMAEVLRQLGLMTGDDEDALYKYFPHAISHGLGIDVHDSLGKPIEFLPGMVVTVEPGIYIPKEKLGVRIEDDILIGENGPINLSAKLPTGF